jgi:hypothetical protein
MVWYWLNGGIGQNVRTLAFVMLHSLVPTAACRKTVLLIWLVS